ncbi:MAG TPA: quinone oxidoreductase [Pyrinomonadaceae bacterium]|jgi:NADPH2:quinone reductase|nr:quinone oxidoreductase [Pyrinomonadaceae bacterium]
MKAIRVNELGGAEKLTLEEVEKPTPKADEVLIKTAAAGINYADTMMRAGNYLTKPDLPFTLGYEAAGTIESLGENVTNLKVGQRVLATTSSGGYAEYATAKAALTMPIPDELGYSEATALLVQGLTALGLLNETKPGQTILIHAAAGGVGTLLVQLAKHKGLKVIGTASSEQKLQLVADLGADFAINYTEEDWTDEVLKATDGKGADWIIEMVGGAIVGKNLKVLAKHGTMWIYGSASNEDFKVSVLSLMSKNHTIRGYWLMNESVENRIRFTKELLEHLGAGRLKIQVTEFPLEQAKEAHEAIENRKTTGKVVLTVSP